MSAEDRKRPVALARGARRVTLLVPDATRLAGIETYVPAVIDTLAEDYPKEAFFDASGMLLSGGSPPMNEAEFAGRVKDPGEGSSSLDASFPGRLSVRPGAQWKGPQRRVLERADPTRGEEWKPDSLAARESCPKPRRPLPEAPRRAGGITFLTQ